MASLGPVGGGGCTATYIGNRTIITAAHCFPIAAQGCAPRWPSQGTVVAFADPVGNVNSAEAQWIDVLGFVPHPDAYGDRVSSCTNAVPPPLCADPNTYTAPSCGLLAQCTTTPAMMWGLKFQYDIAIGYLASDPVGIDPIPVIVGEGYAMPSKGLYSMNGLAEFLATLPAVTLVGYGGGSFNWGGTWAGRDFGTNRLFQVEGHVGAGRDCDGSMPAAEVVPALWHHATYPLWHVHTAPGDSGGPLLLGKGFVHGHMEEPTPLPPTSGLPQRRYLVGVQSTGDDVAKSGMAAPTYAAVTSAWLAAHIGDIDGDGVPDAIDNCVSVPNPDQANCNALAEQERHAQVLGDACDPVPCPEVAAPLLDTVPVSEDSGACFGLANSRYLRSTLHPKPLASHNPYTGVAMADPGKETRYRFCQRNPLGGVFCDLNSGQINDNLFEQSPGNGNPWLPMTLPGLTNSQATYDYPSLPAPQGWDYWADRVTWVTLNWINDPGGLIKPPFLAESQWLHTSRLSGVIGLRGAWSTMLGWHGRPHNGVHSSPEPVGQSGAFLARHYADYAPDAVEGGFFDKCLDVCPSPCGNPIDPTFVLRWCPGCELRPDRWWYPSNPHDLLLVKAQSGLWGAVAPDQRVLYLDDFIGPELHARWNDPALQYLPAAEPFATGGSTDAQGVFLRADAAGIDSRLVARDGRFQLDTRAGGPFLPSAADELAPAAIPPRAGHASVYSRRLGAVIVVGGAARRGRGNALVQTGELWIHPLDRPAFRLEIPEYRPAVVRAATVSAADGALWVLDSPAAGAPVRRLVRIDLFARTVSTVWRHPSKTSAYKTWLVADRDGSVLAFSNTTRGTCTVRFGATPFSLGGERALMQRLDDGLARGPMMVDRGGYQWVTSLRTAFTSVRLGLLRDESGGSPEVNDCW
ncbi:MAG: hypothetical protein KF718_15145 [Polyangiaceae bacterium]|nr:hypothetical protein [Polyangiaceae bacterium]